MLPFSLKVVWFCLSITGTASCWASMLSLVRSVESLWPLVYCVGCTLTHSLFCLGMIYKMDPTRMPRGFCVAQSILIGFGVFMMTGTAASFAIATTYASGKPKTWISGGRGVMVWRSIYVLPLFVFPVLASAVQIAMTIRFDSGFQSDDLHCDYVDPTWIRLFSYAGTPLIITIPCFIFSLKAIIRIWKTNKHLNRSKDPNTDVETFTPLPRRPQNVRRVHRAATPSSGPSDPPSPPRQSPHPALINASRATRTSCIPTALSLDTLHTSVTSGPGYDELESPVSSSFPTFANPPHVGTISVDPDRITIESASPPSRDQWRDILGVADSPDADKPDSLKWMDDGDKSDFEYAKGDDDLDTEENNSEIHAPRAVPRSPVLPRKPRRPLPTLTPTVYRIITFQMGFAVIQQLSTITPLIDVIKHRVPAAFGTQHVALLISAWGPAVVFFQWNGVCRHCSRWFVQK